MVRVLACITQQHDPSLVVLAAIICLLASVTAVSLLRRALASFGRVRVAWLAGAAISFGGGVWATHFIAMLAYLPAAGFGYAIHRTLVSLLLAIVGGFVAFAVAFSRWPAGLRLALGGLLLGTSIGGMHILGMAALRPAHLVSFAGGYVAAALLIAVLAAGATLAAVQARHLALAALAAVFAVCGLHFTAMAGTMIAPLAPGAAAGAQFSSFPLALGVAALTLLVLALALLGAIVDRHLAHRAADEAGRLRRFADATFEGILFLRNGVVADANAALCALLGREREGLLGRPAEWLLSLPGGLGVLDQGGTVEAELIDGAGQRRPVELLSRPLGDARGRDTVLAVRDLSDRKQAEQRIQHLAHHDSLTGLPNRALFRDRLAQAMSMAERTGHTIALLCLDLDGFKSVNDLLGHPVGDQVLIEVGNRLRTCLRDSDTIARLGGDEFAIVLGFCEQPAGASTLGERIVALLAEPFEIGGQQVVIGTSIGIALYPSDAAAPEVLLRNADLALYRAKRDGRGVFRFFEQAMDERLQQRRLLEQDLRGAMQRGELRLHYQPLLDSATLEIDGFEALLRWEHPVRGAISPAQFVPVAEESGLIVPLGEWVLQTACTEAASWSRPWRIAVNLSPAQFKQRDLASSIATILARTGLPPGRLELEITEGILIDDAERALLMLGELKSLGVRIALDDFGTGYSSLSYLRRFPFDKLKIDASFVQGLGDGGEADAIVRAIVALGRSLSLSITAEGVETPHQLALLREQACDQVQGFLLGRPMPPGQLHGMQASTEALVPAA